MNTTPTKKQMQSRAEVCAVYARVIGDFDISEVQKNYERWSSGHKIDGDMLAIGNAHNTNKANQEKHHEH